MADQDAELMSKITYYYRTKYYRHGINATLEGQKKYGGDLVLKFFNAYGLIMEDRLQEGMRELEVLKDKPDVNVCSLMALALAHRRCRNVDAEAVQEYENKMREQRKQAGKKGLFLAGLTMFLQERYEKAREYGDRTVKQGGGPEGLALKGWIDLLSGREALMKKSVKFFDEANEQSDGKFLEALLGKAKFLELHKNFRGALEIINTAVVAFPQFVPALMEKMRIQLALQDWDQTVETAMRCLELDAGCIEALKYNLLFLLCREGNYHEAEQKVGEILQDLDRHEPKNAFQYDSIATLLARLSGRNQLVLQQTIYLQERAVGLEKQNAAYVTNLGHQLLLQERTKDAMKCFRTALSLDESSVAALQGVIHCQLAEDNLQEASAQLEFLHEIQQTLGKSGELSYLLAVLARKRAESQEKILSHLNDAIQHHFAGLTGLYLSPEYYFYLDAPFLVSVVHEYLFHAPQSPQAASQAPHPVLKRCLQILDPLTRTMPGLQEGVFLMAKARFLGGDPDAAQSALRACLEADQAFAEGHILLAQVHLHQGAHKLAEQALEVGLSYNFEVRDHPLYHLVRARLLRRQGRADEAVRTLQTALQMPSVRQPGAKDKDRGKRRLEISSADRLSLFLDLAEAHRASGEQHEAAKVLQDAQHAFAGTPEEVRVTIANADLAIQRGDVEMALGILRTVSPSQTYFVQAREKMAEIYLTQRKDKKLFAACYRELVERHPSPQAYLLLGDAYMRVQEPERAIEVYEHALKRNPRDLALASKMGAALVRTHHFGKAINYYEHALRGGQHFLRLDLARLLLRMRQLEKAERVLKAGLDAEPADLDELTQQARLWSLLAQVHARQQQPDATMHDLHRARDLQARVLKRAMVEAPDAVGQEKQFAATICRDMAAHAKAQKDLPAARKFYEEALVYHESDPGAQLELARVHLHAEELDACQQVCMQMLKADGDNDAATVMMADLMFRKQEYDAATFHFQQLLERRPDHYLALARLVDLLRRAGKLEEVPKFFELAETANARATMDAGYQHCKGLYEWYTGNAGVALRHFNRARIDSDWVARATYNMVEICLNPDNETVGGEVFDSLDSTGEAGSSAEKADSEHLGLKTAEKLLKELKPKADDQRYQYMQNMLFISTKQKANVEKALQSFVDATQDDPDNVCALYGIAAGYMVLKQTPKARNQLKRLAKLTWTIQDAEELERSWLLLSDIYIQAGKFDMAQELLKRCLNHNRSCCKAYEYMGFIMEKEQAFKDAAKNYELAWKYGNKNNPVIGYKLAFNFLKARRFVDAIDICHHVLSAHPNYPKIKKDILDKARVSLRV